MNKKLPIIFKKLPVAEITEMGKLIYEIKRDEYRHQNEMESKKFGHQRSIDKANGIAEYRNKTSELTSIEKEALTLGFVQVLLEKA